LLRESLWNISVSTTKPCRSTTSTVEVQEKKPM